MSGWRRWKEREMSALVADDDPDVHSLVKAALGRYAISSDAVSNGAEAMERLCIRTYDLLILDLAMPGATGFDILRTLRSKGRLQGTSVIVLSANDSDEALARCFGYGADDYVVKPFSANQLGMRAYRLLHV
jgi:two-component system cell cycle response regulator CtrA